MNKTTKFDSLVGQPEIKRQLEFFQDAQAKKGVTPFLMLSGAKGLGKTAFAKAYSDGLKNRDGSKRPFMEINCSTIKSAPNFFEQIFIPYILDNELTVLFDEAHMLPKDLVNAFLTIFNSETVKRKEYRVGEVVYNFDFSLQNFVFATTELDKLYPPFRDRLTIIDFKPYTVGELGEILKINLHKDIKLDDSVLGDIADTTRGNARSAVKRAQEIALYCEAKNQISFDREDWETMRFTLDIKPMGLSNIEIEIVKILRQRGSCSLQMLSAVTGMSRSAIQRDAENYLLKRGLMKINGQREITGEGITMLQMLEKGGVR
jgi:Holliday junction resolvasome RuvABC ATP-dependent DNA helicase subunit